MQYMARKSSGPSAIVLKRSRARKSYERPGILVEEAALLVADEKRWRSFARHCRAEMKQAEKRRLFDLLAAMSQQKNFALGCYKSDILPPSFLYPVFP